MILLSLAAVTALAIPSAEGESLLVRIGYHDQTASAVRLYSSGVLVPESADGVGATETGKAVTVDPRVYTTLRRIAQTTPMATGCTRAWVTLAQPNDRDWGIPPEREAGLTDHISLDSALGLLLVRHVEERLTGLSPTPSPSQPPLFLVELVLSRVAERGEVATVRLDGRGRMRVEAGHAAGSGMVSTQVVCTGCFDQGVMDVVDILAAAALAGGSAPTTECRAEVSVSLRRDPVGPRIGFEFCADEPQNVDRARLLRALSMLTMLACAGEPPPLLVRMGSDGHEPHSGSPVGISALVVAAAALIAVLAWRLRHHSRIARQ